MLYSVVVAEPMSSTLIVTHTEEGNRRKKKRGREWRARQSENGYAPLLDIRRKEHIAHAIANLHSV